jgi:hypothetical protein
VGRKDKGGRRIREEGGRWRKVEEEGRRKEEGG